ncbi:MAG: hypothetical protein ACM3ML_13385 [Micromonosporaceae bacterium]
MALFWSEEHARDHRLRVRAVYPGLAQATALTGPTQSAIFGFPRSSGRSRPGTRIDG